MRAFPVLVATLLSFSVVAGCITDDATDAGTGLSDELVLPEIPDLDGKALLAEVQSYSEAFPKRNANGPNHVAAREYLANEMAEAGLTVVRQTFTANVSASSTPSNVATNDGTLQNVIGIKWGENTRDWIVIGGHYDVTDGAVYGAYDDGSGTIMTLQLARAFATLETERTIAFTMFDGEEQGLKGSGYFAETIFVNENFPETIVHDDAEAATIDYVPTLFAMIDLDMFGINWPTMNPIYFDQNSEAIRAHVDEVRNEIGIPDAQFKFQGISAGRSDYHWFFVNNVPTAFFIASFEEVCANGDICLPEGVTYPFWHRADTVESMELMAGGREPLEAGFDVAAELATKLLYWEAVTPGLTLSANPQE